MTMRLRDFRTSLALQYLDGGSGQAVRPTAADDRRDCNELIRNDRERRSRLSGRAKQKQ